MSMAVTEQDPAGVFDTATPSKASRASPSDPDCTAFFAFDSAAPSRGARTPSTSIAVDKALQSFRSRAMS
jgi:hypothetical protein